MRANNKGITLIALIVTIVVLIILATISVNLLMNGNIIGRAEQSKSIIEQAQENEQEDLKKLANMLDENYNGTGDQDNKQIHWVERPGFCTPYYPDLYPNNCNLHSKLTYGDDVKAIKLVVQDADFERFYYGYSDFLLFKDKNNLMVKVCDGADGEELIFEGNSLDYYLISDGSATARGANFKVYTTNDDFFVPSTIYPTNSSVRFTLPRVTTQSEQQKIHIKPEKIARAFMDYRIFYERESGTGWNLFYNNEATGPWDGPLLDTLVTITNTEGEVLYSKEINDGTEKLEPDFANLPEDIIINIERRGDLTKGSIMLDTCIIYDADSN